MHPLRFVSTLEDVIGIGKSRLKVTEFEHGVLGNVVGRVCMQLRRTLAHGSFGGKDRRQFFVLDLDEFQRLLGYFRAGRRDRRYRLPRVTNGIAHNQHVLDHTGRQSRHEKHRAELDLGYVFWQQNGLYPRQRLGRRRVDADDARVRIWTAQQLGMQHARERDIDRKALASPNLLKCIRPQNAFPNDACIRHVTVPSGLSAARVRYLDGVDDLGIAGTTT